MDKDIINDDEISLILNDKLITRIKKFNKYFKTLDERLFNYIITVNLRLIVYYFIGIQNDDRYNFAEEIYETLNHNKTFINQIADFNIYIHSIFPASYLRNIKDNLIKKICVLYKNGIKSKDKKIYDKAVIKLFTDIDYFWIILLMKYVQLYE